MKKDRKDINVENINIVEVILPCTRYWNARYCCMHYINHLTLLREGYTYRKGTQTSTHEKGEFQSYITIYFDFLEYSEQRLSELGLCGFVPTWFSSGIISWLLARAKCLFHLLLSHWGHAALIPERIYMLSSEAKTWESTLVPLSKHQLHLKVCASFWDFTVIVTVFTCLPHSSEVFTYYSALPLL